MFSRRNAWIACAIACLSSAYAQDVPESVRPGQIERQFQQPPEARAVDDLVVLDIPSQQAPPNAMGITITVREFRINGATEFTRTELLQPFLGLIGNEVPLSRIYDVANSITAKYRNAGFVLTRALVAEQRFEQKDAVVNIEVVEGFVAGMEYRGDIAGRRKLLDRMADKVVGERPHRQATLERHLLLLNDMAGASAAVSGTYVPMDDQPGGFKVIVDLGHDRFTASVSQTNRGSELLGPNQTQVNLGFNSLLRGYEQTFFRYISAGSSEELSLFSIGQTYWLGPNGSKLTWTVGHTDSEPELGVNFSAFNLETESTNGSLTYEYPITRSRRRNVDLRLGFTYHDGRTEDELFGNTRDQIAALRAGLTLDWIDGWRGINLFDIEYSQGLDAFGASDKTDPDISRPGGRPDFGKISAYFARVQAVAGPVSVLFAAEGQGTDHNLLSPEEFAVGGPTFGRAYDASEIVGDSGASGKVELRLQFGSDDDRGNRAMIYAFYEGGFVLREEAVFGQPRRESLTAAGGGVRFSTFGWLNGYVEAAVPISRPVAIEGSDDTRVFGGVSLQF